MKDKLNSILQTLPHDAIHFISCVIVISGMYFSRALMSIGMIVLFISVLLNPNLLEYIKRFFSKPHLVIITGYFFLIAFSFFWSSNVNYYEERIKIILPFLILPFSFFSMNQWEKKWYDALLLLFIILNLSGIGWSVFEYLQNKEMYDAGYGYSKLIPTPFKNDHIRFSIAVVMSICFVVDLFIKYSTKIIRVLLVVIVLIDIFYIHLLSAKTGIVTFYLVAAVGIFQILFSVKYKKSGFVFLFLLMMFPFIMYSTFPSFKNKIGYFLYSVEQMKNETKETNISDEGRMISYRYAIDIIQKQPFLGVGVGDVFDEMADKYHSDFNKDENVTILLPHNQFLMVGVAVGIGGILYLIIMMISIFKLVQKNDFLYLSFCLIMLFAMLVEPLFETQYGTCLFLFFLLLLMKRSKYHLVSV